MSKPRIENVDQAHPFGDARSLTRSALEDGSLLSGQFWGELRTFLAVAKTRSLTKAADQLGASHTTVGRQIRRLQDMTGSQLVTISKAGARLTPKGEELARSVLRFDREIYTITNELRGEAKNAEGTVRLSITDGLGVIFVVPALRRFSTEYPRLQVHLKSPVNVTALRENQTDLMIGFSPDAAQDTTSYQLGWLHFLPFISRSYLEKMGLPTRENLEQHLFIDSEIYSARTSIWRSWNEAVARGRVAHYCDASITYAMLVKAGVGIGLLGNYNVLEPSAIPLELNVRISLPLYVIALTERLQAKPVHIVFKYICAVFGPSTPWFSENMRLEVNGAEQSEGYDMLFNL